MNKLMLDQAIIDAFAKAGLPLEHFEHEGGDLWQYDGFDYGNNILVQINLGINGRYKVGVFGDYHSNNDRVHSITGTMSEWMQTFGQYLPQMAKGEELNF